MHCSLWRTLVLALVLFPVSLGGSWGAEAVGEAETPAMSAPEESAGAPEAGEEAAPDVSPEMAVEPTPTMPSEPPAAEIDGVPGADAAAGMIAPPIASIEVKGNERIAAEDILRVIGSKAGGAFSEQQVDEDREAVRRLGWFQRVAVQQEVGEDGVRLVFQVEENPLVEEVQFEGIEALTREELLGVMKTQPGQVYSAALLLEDKDAIQKLYESKRYDLAMVVGQRMVGGVLTLSIAEGEIEAIRIEGNTRTKEYVIRRYVRTKPGEVYNGRKLSRDVTRLINLGYFETVRYEADVGDEPGKVVVVITVVEKRLTGNAGFGLMYASVQGLVGFVDLVKTNLGGTGQTASLRGEFGGRTSYELGYQHPWVMTPETRLNLNLYNSFILREAFVNVEGDERRSVLYDERRAGGNLTLGRPVSDHTTVFLRFRSDDVSISGLAPEEEEYLAGAAFAPRDVRSVTLAAATDTRDSNYNPRRGSYSQLSTEFAGVFGGVNFNKYVSDIRRYFPIGSDKAVAMRLMGGLVTGDAPYLEQFLVGGGDSLRGFRTDRFVGTRMAILNTEYRFQLSSNLLGVVFVDVGDAWGGPVASDPAFEDVANDAFAANVGYGVGVRVKTPIGPLRLDLGFSEEGTETHFGVRHMF